jgi:hypothetical protein
LLLWAISAVGLPLAVITNTSLSVWGWLGALFWELVFLLALLNLWVTRRG